MKERKIGRRKFLKGLAAGSGLVALGAGFSPRRAWPQRRFKTSVLAFGHSQALLAEIIKEDLGSKYGIDLAVKITVEPRTIYTMMLARGVDFYFTGWLTLSDLVARNQVKGKNIGAHFYADAPIYVLAKSPIKSIVELKGKKVGAYGSAAGTSTQMLAVVLKDSFGLDLFKDFQILFGAPGIIHKTLERGELDAVYNTAVSSPEILNEDRFRIIMRPRDEWYKKTGVRLLITTVATYDELLEKNPEGVKAFLAARAEAVNMLKKDEAMAISRVRKLTGMKDEEALKLLTRHIVENFTSLWNDKVIEVHKEFGRRVVEMFGKDKVAGVPDASFTTAYNP